MKDFKNKQQMMEGHYCWGGKAMKKAKGGYARGGEAGDGSDDANMGYTVTRTMEAINRPMRSESTQNARAKRDLVDAYEDAKPSYNPIKNISDIVSGRAMEKGAALSNSLDRKKQTDAQTGEYKKGGMAKGSKSKGKDMQPPMATAAPAPMAPRPMMAAPAGAMPVRRPMGMPIAAPAAAPYKKGGKADDERMEKHSDMGEERREKRMAKGGNWIAGAVKNKGALHRSLGVPMGEKIPAKKLNAAMHSDNPTIAKRARLAKTLKSFHKG